MPPRKLKTKAEDLARIRNNQRKCRERRRAYIDELERKVTEFEAKAAREEAEREKLTQKLLRENGMLKNFILSSGVSEDVLQQRLGNVLSDSNINEGSAPISMQTPYTTLGSGILSENVTDLWPSSEVTPSSFIDFFTLIGESEDATLDQELFSGIDQPALDLSALDLPMSGPVVEVSDSERAARIFTSTNTRNSQELGPPKSPQPTTNEATESSTMLCSVAYRLIMQCGRGIYDDLELEMKLRHGYRKGRTPFEGCRIENKVLFSVLAEISS
ncbi:hypothetical protein AJ80_00889 [Polytolypa hystricis UAMH7299]|uniref:BZIP domain-containing protein n=1 Tax=Polytolypa hystricis (strain UAMH7299) TaxID=1447883 RepID=A0A2B7Z258_POLH7|nr:hypothetical protein AJ80_00889 [Polytolypa hystricis UAMH7299]